MNKVCKSQAYKITVLVSRLIFFWLSIWCIGRGLLKTSVTDVFLPKKLLAESVFLLCGDFSGGESWIRQSFFQPLGQQSWTVSVQSQQYLREMLRQTSRRLTSNRLRQKK